jgi:3-hydroxybutyryl-CoA dehydrogenase
MKIALLYNKELERENDDAGGCPIVGLEAIFSLEDIVWARVQRPEELAIHRDADLYMDLDFVMDGARIETLARLLPAPVFVSAVVPTLKEIGRPFIRINAWPGFLERSIHELVAPDEETAQQIGRLYERLNKAFRLVPDIPGMISGRVIAAIINEAYHTLQDEVSTKEEIDTAMKLGTNYPYGPFEWSERIGLLQLDGLLTELSKTADRYTPAAALKRALREPEKAAKKIKM